MKIYTKKGDKGHTFLADGTAHGKEELIYEVIGTIDELNSWIGYILSVGENFPSLKKIQNNLFAINAILAKAKNIKFNVKRETELLERKIDKMERELPTLKNFILPGGHGLSSILHITRTVCRRAERTLVRRQHVNPMVDKFIPYFNRLSDYFFTLARQVNLQREIKETIWKR